MDLVRLGNLEQLNVLYPGHFDPEVSLFSIDSANRSISNDFKELSDEECLDLAGKPVPPSCIQMMRFRCRAPQDELSSTERERNRIELGSLVSVLDCLGFPLSPVTTARRDLHLVLGRHWATDNDPNQPNFYMGGSRSCLIWSPNLTTKSTRAVLVTFMRSVDEETLRLHRLLQMVIMPEFQICFSHPMFLALVLVRTIEFETMSAYTRDAVSLHQIENTFVTVKSAGRIETMQQLRDLGRLASHDRFIFSSLQKLLELSCKVNEHLGLKDESFFWHVTQLQDTLAVDTAFLTNIGESVMNQQTALMAIINMQDGASMKTIAFITMVFLPGTFAATLFAMPMFQWSDELGRITSRQFWLYWAVVGPLTLTVLLLWSSWWYWRSVRREYDDKTSMPTEDFRDWLIQRFQPKHLNIDLHKTSSVGHQSLEGNKMRPFLKEFYKPKSNSTSKSPWGSYVV